MIDNENAVLTVLLRKSIRFNVNASLDALLVDAFKCVDKWQNAVISECCPYGGCPSEMTCREHWLSCIAEVEKEMFEIYGE